MSKEAIKAKRIENLKEVQAARKENSLQRVYQAIERLKRKREKINFNSVAREADVSVSYLYKYPEIKELISGLRQDQISILPKPVSKPSRTQSTTEQSQSKREARLQERINQLEAEKQELKRKNEALAGQVFRSHQLEEQIERQQKTIEHQQETIKNLENQLSNPLNQPSASLDNPKVTPIEQGRLKQESISDEVKLKFSQLGLTFNPTLLRTLQSASPERILSSIEALETAMVEGRVKNPEGWLNKSIQEGWPSKKQAEQKADLTFFSQWFDLAYEQGLVVGRTRGEDGKLYVFVKDESRAVRVPFEQMATDYPIEVLRANLP